MDGAGRSGVVEMRVTIAARASTVFRFFTEPERFAQWMGGGATGQPVPGTTIDARPGGAMVVTYPGGARALGEVVEVDEPRRIVFTWGYEGGANGMPPGSCRVTITLEETADGTSVTLRHEGISTEEVRKGHETGWRFYLSVLAAKGCAEQFAGGVESVCAAYFGAWNADDARSRRGMLEEACDRGVVFRDGYGCVEGIEALDAHIANSRKHMPGLTIRARGGAGLSHGWVRMAWSVSMGGGPAMMTGENFARLSMDGKLREVIGFADAPEPVA